MKNIIITLLVLFGANQLNAQYAPLKIGEAVPDFEFAIQNYHSPTAKLSDFRGKLIILDFWSTDCTSCFYSFPKMEKLQEQYGDKIQVILVNIRESAEKINAKMKRRKQYATYLDRFPSIIDQAAFFQLFPHPFAGNYVWIDGNGILRLSSAMQANMNHDKINDVLNGKEITFLKHGVGYNSDPNNEFLFNIIRNSSKQGPELSSTITPINLDYFPEGGQELNIVDSVSNTTRSTYINRSSLQLYANALEEEMKAEWKSKVYGPYLGGSNYLDLFKILVKDSTIYNMKLIPKNQITDKNIIKSFFCYEQIAPLASRKEDLGSFMKQDLDRYFGLHHGTKVTIEEMWLPSYSIKKMNTGAISEKDIKKKLKYLGKREFETTIHLGSIVGSFFRDLELELPYVFDVDDQNKKNQIIMPVWKKGDTVEDFQKALSLNGLEFVKENRNIKMIVVRDKY